MLPKLSGVGGMASFQQKMASGLYKLGYQVTFVIQDTPYDAVLVIGGTRDLIGLRSAKRKGIPIIHRLNGMNWIHKVRKTGIRHYLRAEYGNLILTYIRERIADRIVYQSKFAQSWWEDERGTTDVPFWIVHNGVDLDEYNPSGTCDRSIEKWRVLMVEGNVGGGYEFGLETGSELLHTLIDMHSQPVELMVVGSMDRNVREKWQVIKDGNLKFAGQVEHDQIPQLDRSAHVLYSADINAACPNSVVEAMACGLPVAGFDTGALDELVSGHGGEVVPYGGDHWKLEPPDIQELADSVSLIFQSQNQYRTAARERAESAFGLDKMVNGYIDAIIG